MACRFLLTDSNGRTRRGSCVEKICSYIISPKDSDIIVQNIWECGESPLLAVMSNPLHVDGVGPPRLFKVSCHTIRSTDTSCLRECHAHELEVPMVSAEQKLVFAMYSVRELSPDHAFAAWVVRWLANIDRSDIGAILARRELERTAEQIDGLLSAHTWFWQSKKKHRLLHEDQFEFLRRARDVVDAAITLIEQPERWQVTVAELIATATSGLHSRNKRIEFAELATKVVTLNGNMRVAEQRVELSRCVEEDSPTGPSTNVNS